MVMTFEEIYAVDVSNMYRLLKEFPAQVREAIGIGKKERLRLKRAGVKQIVLSGLGGSAIAGDLLRNYLAGEMKIPFLVNRQYTLPASVGRETLLIISSYSGNTEETNSAHREARKRRAKILCISSGGKTEKMARVARQAILKIPGGLPPRAALGYSFFPLLLMLIRLGFVRPKDRDIAETLRMLEKKSQEYGIPEPSSNRALQLAEFLRNRIGVVYAGGERFESVATRWRGQVGENGKGLLFGHVLPEMNHNEIVGWKNPEDALRELAVVFLRDKGDHPRVHRRMELTKQIIGERTQHIAEVWSEGTSLLARMFSLVYLGDWMSYYLAVLQGEDPTPVKVIDYLKEEMGKG
jgi:glucose/mannose-6-phosphate isomerase